MWKRGHIRLLLNTEYYADDSVVTAILKSGTNEVSDDGVIVESLDPED